MNPGELLAALAKGWVGVTGGHPALRALMASYQDVRGWAQREKKIPWCALWVVSLARSIVPGTPWLGNSTEVIAKGQALPVGVPPREGEILARHGHVGVYIGGGEVVAGNESDSVVRRPFRDHEWSHRWRWWGASS